MPSAQPERWGPRKKRRNYRERKMPNLLKELSNAGEQAKNSREQAKNSREQAKKSREQAQQTQAEKKENSNTSRACGQGADAEQDVETSDGPKDTRKKETVVVSNIVINHASMATLNDEQWLDDCIVDAYMLVAANKSRSEKVWTFSVHVLRQMAQTTATRELRQEMQARYDGIESALWLVPFNTNNYQGPMHWVMFVVSLSAQRIVYVDSLAPRNPPPEALEHVMALVAVCRGPRTWAGWRLVIPDDQVRQQDQTSCGVLICHTAASTCQSNISSTVPSSPPEQSDFARAYRREMKQQLVQVSVWFRAGFIWCLLTINSQCFAVLCSSARLMSRESTVISI